MTTARPTRRGAVVPYLVGVAGGSGSGKTALVQAIAETLGPGRSAVLSHDAYYRDQSALEEAARAALDFDAPEALDMPLFVAHLHALRAGHVVRPPRYCFVTHRRIGKQSSVEPREVVLVDGILLLHDPDVRAALDLKIYLDAPEPLRRARRLARDTRERGRSPDSVLAQLDGTVRAGHAAWVEPTRMEADLVLLNAGPLRPLVEVATTLIRLRLEERAVETSVA
jgi:uridine kinase